jgi:AhpD family alkylhydroperoxidase
MDSQVELNEARLKIRDKYKKVLPDVSGAMDALQKEVYRDGALSLKVKRLMSLAIALRVGCVNCILAQTLHALEEGASVEEILETLSVEISMSGTTGIAESLRVVKLLEELGKI